MKNLFAWRKDLKRLLGNGNGKVEEEESPFDFPGGSGNGKDERLLETALLEQGSSEHGAALGLLGPPWQGPTIDLKTCKIEQEALKLVPQTVAQQCNALPLQVLEEGLLVALGEPENLTVIDSLSALCGMPVVAAAAPPGEIEVAIERFYKSSEEIERNVNDVLTDGLVSEEDSLSAEGVSSAPLVRSVDLLLTQAIKDRASDIHLHPEEEGVQVKYRVDGILHDVLTLPKGPYSALVSRVKIMAGMNVAERRRPQDGQFAFRAGARQVDVRASIANTTNGEMVVLRLLDKAMSIMEISELGMTPEVLAQYRAILRAPYGMILISGPTGAGKTTSLYASLNEINIGDRNIITIEDPVEYRIRGINQMQVNPKAGLTFATGLRAALRLDPDVILVGEVRDQETAHVATQAAMTGHLVLSSVHANDTVSTILRMLDLEVEPFQLSSGLVGLAAQRMVRRVCLECRRMVKPTREEKVAFEAVMAEQLKGYYQGIGCNVCNGTGYLGRIGVFEVLVVTESLRALINAQADNNQIRTQAIKEGLIPMRRDGMRKVLQGITTPQEVLRNVFNVGLEEGRAIS